jgi:hypothetical protein
MRSAILAAGAISALLAFAAPASAHFFTDEAIESIAPVVIFHGDERYHPSSGEEFIDHSGLAWNHDGGCGAEYKRKRFLNGVETPWSETEVRMLGTGAFAQGLRTPRDAEAGSCRLLPGARNLFSTSQPTRPYGSGRDARLGEAEGWYLDLARSDRPGMPDRVKGSIGYQTAAPAYFDDGLLYLNGVPTGFAFVTFWFFYNYDDGPSFQNHEGDWEDVSIRLMPVGDREWQPIEVYYAKHGDKLVIVRRSPDLVDWDRAFRVSLGGEERLGVYSAKGTHGSYGNGISPWTYLDRVDHNGPRWDTRKRLRFLWSQDWVGYCGAWGVVGGIADTTGPLGAACLRLDASPAKSGGPAVWGTSKAQIPEEDLGNTIVRAGG